MHLSTTVAAPLLLSVPVTCRGGLAESCKGFRVLTDKHIDTTSLSADCLDASDGEYHGDIIGLDDILHTKHGELKWGK
jgi:hypothetical protein